MNLPEKTEKMTIHTIETAPEGSKELLLQSKKAHGFIPNLHGVLAEAPTALAAYIDLHKHFMKSSFDKDQLTVVWQTINVEHDCHYCVPGHTGIAKAMKVDDAIIDALRNQTAMPTEKLQALHLMTLSMTRNRGIVSQQELTDFYAAGYSQSHVLEIILGLSQKVISNYTNSVAATPLDSSSEKYVWTKKVAK